MSDTPVFDEVNQQFKEAQAAGFFRGRIAGHADIIAELKQIKKPSREVLAIIEKAEGFKNGTK